MNLYTILGLRPEATLDDIKRAYRRLARKYHPGLNPGDRAAAEHFRRITEAFETLADPERRRRYDIQGARDVPDVAPQFTFTGFDFTLRMDGRHASSFGELFADALGTRRPAGPEHGVDLHATLNVTFDESVRGTEQTVSVTRLERCAPCGGLGVIGGAATRCPPCEGTGQVRGARGHMVFSRACASCGGTGTVRHRVCAACGGEGVGVHADAVRVPVPAGVTSGAQVVVPGQGHAGRRGGEPGDLRVTIQVHEHPFFHRSGDDVLIEVPIQIHEAALGARVDVPGLDGPIRMRIPPGTQSGQSFRLRERGLPSARTGLRGDLVVTVRLVLPSVLDQRSRELLQEFGQINTENVRKALGV